MHKALWEHLRGPEIFTEKQTPEMRPGDKKFIRWKVEVGISDERTCTKSQRHENNGILRDQLRWCWQMTLDGPGRARSVRVYILC